MSDANAGWSVISLDRCEEHGNPVLTLGDEWSTTAFAGSRCCRRRKVLQEWRMDAAALRDAINEFGCELERLLELESASKEAGDE